ncbi:class F sortase [Corynebacterium tapiri]
MFLVGRTMTDSPSDVASPRSETPSATSSAPIAPALPVQPEQPAFVDHTGAQENLPIPVTAASDRGVTAISVDGVTAPIDALGLTDEGALVPPEDIQRVGWYAESTIPGADQPGTSVITGHVNDAAQGTGFANRFTHMDIGTKFSITVNGQPRIFKVTKASSHVPKGGALPAEVNDATGPNRIVLITCGGKFVGGPLGYEDNIFVVAEPA